MKQTRMRTWLLPVTALALAGCQGLKWEEGGASYTAAGGAFSVAVPGGWFFMEKPPGRLLATKDGLTLQRMQVESLDLATALPNSKRVLPGNLSALELAEAMTDELRAQRSLLGLEVRVNRPAPLGGRPGVELVCDYHTQDKLAVRQEEYAALAGGRLFVLTYAAPARFFFDRDLADFEAAARSFRGR